MGSIPVKDFKLPQEIKMMSGALAMTLQLINPTLPSSLISAEDAGRITTLAHALPGAMTAFFGFECRLGEAAPAADFLLSVTATEGGRDILAGTNPAASLPPLLLAQPTWERLANFCQVWAEPGSPLARPVHNLWLEFDVAAQVPDISLPNCFFGLCLRAGEARNWINETAIPLLRGESLPTSVEQKLLAAFEALPEEAYVFQIGLMLARPAEAVRVCIRNITPAQIPAYLSQLGWPGEANHLARLVAEVSRWVDRIDLDLDVGTRILPKIGLECYFNHQVQPKVEPRWQAFLDFLVDQGLCQPAKREGLLAYPGYVREKDNPGLWPPHLRAASSFLGERYEGVFFKGLHHIKIVYQPEKSLEAKAYLYIGQSWLSGITRHL
jgi:hypothetical protein